MTNKISPTTFPKLNTVLQELLNSVIEILDQKFLAAYLQGSFAGGDADVHSDVDFLVVVKAPLTNEEVAAINTMHGRIHQMDTHWAQHLEGSYFPAELLKKADPTKTPIHYVDNGATEITLSDHDNTLVVRWVTREHGITLSGPPPQTFIDPVPADQLRHEVRQTMHEWGQEILSGTYQAKSRWAQPYLVLSYCRMLHTLETGHVFSKKAGGEWAIKKLPSEWRALIQQALDDRPDPWERVYQPADPGDIQCTLDFIRYSLSITEQIIKVGN
jgi:predicted nucleotidyltransferase